MVAADVALGLIALEFFRADFNYRLEMRGERAIEDASRKKQERILMEQGFYIIGTLCSISQGKVSGTQVA